MDSISAFMMGEINRDKPMRVFDWNKAAKRIKETNCKTASAGLSGDWEWTGGTIYNNGPIMDSYTFLASTWATPELELDGEVEDCWVWTDDSGWGSGTKWPQSALDILCETN